MCWHGRSTNKRHQHLPGMTLKSNYKMLLPCTSNGDLPRPLQTHTHTHTIATLEWPKFNASAICAALQARLIMLINTTHTHQSSNWPIRAHSWQLAQKPLHTYRRQLQNGSFLLPLPVARCQIPLQLPFGIQQTLSEHCVATGYWLLLLLLLLMMQIIRNCIDYALGSQLWPLPLPFECQLKWSIKTGCLYAYWINTYITCSRFATEE